MQGEDQLSGTSIQHFSARSRIVSGQEFDKPERGRIEPRTVVHNRTVCPAMDAHPGMELLPDGRFHNGKRFLMVLVQSLRLDWEVLVVH